MTKTEVSLSLISKIFSSPKNEVDTSILKELSGSKSAFYRNLKEFTETEIEGAGAIFKRIQQGETDKLILNRSMLKHFIPEHLETAFVFEAYKKLGAMISSSNFESDVKELKKMFLN